MAKTKRNEAMHPREPGTAAVWGVAICLLGGAAGCTALLALFALLLAKTPLPMAAAVLAAVTVTDAVPLIPGVNISNSSLKITCCCLAGPARAKAESGRPGRIQLYYIATRPACTALTVDGTRRKEYNN